MTDLRTPLALALALALASPALAQDVAGDAAAAAGGLSLGESVDEDTVGAAYIADTFSDWELVCIRTEEGNDPCEMYQLLLDQTGNSVAEVTMIALPAGGEAVAGGNIVTPLGTLLPQQLTLQVDDGAARRYPFTWCNAIGCIARVGFTAPEIEAFKRGGSATITIFSVEAPGEPVNLTMSLMGFTAAYEAVTAANAN